MESLLSLIFLLPLFVAFGLLAIPSRFAASYKWISLVTIAFQLVGTIWIALRFDKNHAATSWAEAFQWVERVPWIRMDLGFGSFNADYFVGIDGISLPLVVLTSIILLVGVLSSWNITEKMKGYFFLYLLLSSSIVGCFISLDFFLFYICFEFMLLPMFFLIGIWGGERRSYASIKFFLYTLLGSLFILVVMIGLYQSTVDDKGALTFSLVAMLDGQYLSGSVLEPGSTQELWGYSYRSLAFLFLLIGFGIKLPFVPLHTWLPDAHVEAPTPISVILAGLLLKVGGYGFFRIAYGIFPDMATEYQVTVGILGVLSIIYGGLNALAQNDLKKLIAYSSVSHMGFVLIGLTSLTTEGLSGGLFQMVSHGLISPALFILVGVVYDRTHNRQIENFSGLANKMPVYTFFVALFFFAGLGLPGLPGFVGELMVLLGAFASSSLPKWIAILSILGIIISAAYFLWVIQRMFFGTYFVRNEEWNGNMKDLTSREWIMLAGLGVMVIALGIYPKLVLDLSEQTIHLFIQSFSR